VWWRRSRGLCVHGGYFLLVWCVVVCMTSFYSSGFDSVDGIRELWCLFRWLFCACLCIGGVVS
jgi:hypothetical protein